MNCKLCGGSTTGKNTPKGEVFECNQDNGDCLNERGYPTSTWAQTRGGNGGGARRPAPARNGASNGAARSVGIADDVKEFRIVRQHSQEMALRHCAIKGALPATADELRKLIDWFQYDATNIPKAAKPTIKPQPEPEPEPTPREVAVALAIQDEAPSDDIF